MSSLRMPANRQLEPWQNPEARPFIRIDGVTRNFGSVYAVDNLSLDIYQGEFFALLGPSGCGKSTLLRMLAGFEAPNAGRIEIDGQDMSAVPPWKRPVNMMFQSYALFPHMTVEGNIAFGLRQDGIARGEIAERVAEVARLVQLTDFLKRKPNQLSGGQRQRVALARALVKEPKVLLLDEPLGALDRKLRERTQFELVNIQEKLGISFIIVTHDQEEAMTVSTRMALMRDGRIEQLGTPGEVYESPASRFVADFIGDVNLFDARVIEASAVATRLQSDDPDCLIDADRNFDLVAGQSAGIAIRPEKFTIHTQEPQGHETNLIAGEVWDIAYLGDISIYHVKTRTGAVIRASQANRARLVERPITWEQPVWLTWSPDATLVLKA